MSLRPRRGYPPTRVTNHHEAIVSRGRLYVPAEVMIKTGKTTVAFYALAPILDSFNRAFREK